MMGERKAIITVAALATLLFTATGTASGIVMIPGFDIKSGSKVPESSVNKEFASVHAGDLMDFATKLNAPSSSGGAITNAGDLDAKKVTTTSGHSQGRKKPSQGDTVPPVVTATPGGGMYASDQWIHLSVNEAATIYYTTDGTTPSVLSTVYISDVHLMSSATLKYFAKDTTGNSGSVQTQLYTIDLSAPSIAITQPADGSQINGGDGETTVAGAAFDAETRVTSVEIGLDSYPYLQATPMAMGNWSSWMATLLISEPGLHRISARALDEAGRESLQTISVTVAEPIPSPIPDTIAPETAIVGATDGTGAAVVDGGSTVSSSLSVSFYGTDDGGISSYEGSIDGGAWSSASSPAILTVREGIHRYNVRSIDLAGNIDTTPASISWTVNSSDPLPTPAPQPLPDDLPVAMNTINVSTIQDMMNAIKSGKPGDHIVLKSGSYDTTQYLSANSVNRLLVTADGTAANPIVIRAENVGSVEISGPASFYLNGASYVVIYGFKFVHSQDDSAATDDIAIRCNNCDNVRFAHNVFALTTSFPNLEADVDRYHSDWVGITGTSSDNRVDHNEFRNKFTRGVFLFLFGANGRVVQNTLVDHNLFSGQSFSFGNGGECFRIGNSALGPSPGNMIMEYNIFENCNGDREAVTIKASNNLIRYNIFRNNEGSLTFRHGNANTADGNMFIDGNTGIRAYGHDHRIINNYFANNPMTVSSLLAPIVLGKGTVENDLTTSNSEHSQPRNILIAHNTLVDNRVGIVIGYGSGTYPPSGIIVANNIVTGSTGKLVTVYTGSSVTFTNNLLYPTSSATIGDVPPTGYQNLDPQLVSSDGMMIPSTTSPAVNAVSAADAYGVTTDISGRTRSGMFDLGAYEVA